MGKKNKIYLAGPLFTVYEQEACRKEYAILKNLATIMFEGKEEFPEIYAPIYASFNTKNPSATEIFKGDYKELVNSTALIVNLSNQLDNGTVAELAMAIERKIPVFCHYNDLRFGRKSTDPFEQNVGFNQFVVGAIYSQGRKISMSFIDAVRNYFFTLIDRSSNLMYHQLLKLEIWYEAMMTDKSNLRVNFKNFTAQDKGVEIKWSCLGENNAMSYKFMGNTLGEETMFEIVKIFNKL